MSAEPDAIQDNLEIETPEHIVLRYELAGLGSRFVAVMLDGLTQFLVLATIFGLVWRLGTFLQSRTTVFTAIVVVSFSALFSLAYFIAFELAWKGQSPGKRWIGLRVIRSNGTPLSLTESAVRNIVRIVDWLPLLYVVGGLFVFFSRYCQRVGDFAAGTLVVRERLAGPPRRRTAAIADQAVVLRLSREELDLVERFRERRTQLDPAARARLAAQIAQRLREQYPGALPAGAAEETVDQAWRLHHAASGPD
ncbi:MAG TPA: RDD family protein [Armatimonadota bacterium]|jgi:uncharacterized RDD family membrane protein YckC